MKCRISEITDNLCIYYIIMFNQSNKSVIADQKTDCRGGPLNIWDIQKNLNIELAFQKIDDIFYE